MDPEAVEALLGKRSGSARSTGSSPKPAAVKSGNGNHPDKSRDLLSEAKTGAAG
jgi:hypothetical protein